MTEPIRVLIGEVGGLGSDEIAPRETGQTACHVPVLAVGQEFGQGSGPERPPDDRGSLEEMTLGLGQAIEPGCPGAPRW